MDLMALDLTDIEGAALYDNVTLIGKNGDELVRADDIARWSKTICYEIICGIMARVPRVYEGI
jgi:alanine racemase